MNFKKRTKAIMAFCLVVVLCLSNVYSAEAAKKIKSKSVSMNTTEVTMSVGDVATLSAVMKPANSTDTLKWSTSDKNVATVNKYGVVTALKEGKVTITVKTSSKKKAKCTITVKKYLTQDEIASLISADCLAEETILDLIKKNSISEDTVKKLIKENSISEDTVKKLIKENAGTSSDTSSEWEDGTALTQYEGQTLPLKMNGVTINSVTVKKEHTNEIRGRIYSIYKYCIEIKGKASANKDFGIAMCYLTNSGAESQCKSYYCNVEDDNNVVQTYTMDEDGNFVIKAEQYNLYGDYDKFVISDWNID